MRNIVIRGEKKTAIGGLRFVMVYRRNSVLYDATGAVITLDPVAATHFLDPYFTTRTGSMQEAAITEVNSDMGEGASHRVEKDEIARLELLAIDDIADLALFVGGSRQQLAEGLPENDLDIAAAVQTRIRIRAAAPVIDADKLQSLEDQVLRTRRVALEQRRFFAHALLFRGDDGIRRAQADGSGSEQYGEFLRKIHGGEI